MTFEQGAAFALLAVILGMMLWGRFRYDLVAFGGLLLAVVLGLVPQDEAFSGFSNPAVLIVAFVLIASRAFETSGALTLFTRWIGALKKSVTIHVGITSGIGAALSAVINNVAALALLMPLDIEAARKADRPPGLTLMPLAFATILGGMITLIGTPPNILASSIRAERLGEPYHLFDFAPVGLAVTVCGVLFVALVGWRLVPRREDKTARMISESSFSAEVTVPESATIIDDLVADLDEMAENADVIILGRIRGGRTMYARARGLLVKAGDRLIVEGSSDGIAAFIRTAGLHQGRGGDADENEPSEDQQPSSGAAPSEDEEEREKDEKEEKKERAAHPEIVEAAVPFNSRLVGRSAREMDLRHRFGVTLLGIARAGVFSRGDVRDRIIEAGDVLLLAGRSVAMDTVSRLGVVLIGKASIASPRPLRIALVIGLFVGALIAAATGLLSFTVAVAIAVAGYAAFGILHAREIYSQIDWSVIVMIACLLPVGAALDRVGGTVLIAQWIEMLTFGSDPVVALVAVMVVTMMLSDVLNNVATIVIMGPVSITLAERLQVNPDTFLMSVAVGASCAFLTPIGHKNNTLIMGPGGFRFGDYWRLGICLELVVVLVGVPMLLMTWPLNSTG